MALTGADHILNCACRAVGSGVKEEGGEGKVSLCQHC